MHTRRLASLLIGAWLAAGVLMDFVVVSNFRQVDAFLTAPGPSAADQIHTLGGPAEARLLLRRETGELNRYLFEQWESAQLVLGVALLGLLVFGRGEAPRWALAFAAFMLLIVLTDRLYFTPHISALGRLLDYPRTPGANKSLFWTLHGIYSGLELLKLACGFAVAGSLVTRLTDRDRFAREHHTISRAQSGLSRG